MTNARPFRKSTVWVDTVFCEMLSAITLVGATAMYANSPSANPGMLPLFLCNLPLVFLFAAHPVKLAHDRIQDLENRLLKLEAAQAAK